MQRRGIRIGFLVFFVGLVAVADAGQTRSGTVLKVFDGDTVELTSGEIIRLLGIDSPESNSRNRQILSQPFYRQARDALVALVDKKRVVLTESARLVGPYGRTLAYLHLPDGTDVQLKMLQGGYAMMTAYPPDLGHLDNYAAAESEARQRRAGMWDEPYFSVLPLAQGIPKKDGPVRVSGIITSVSLTGKNIKIIIGERLTLHITHAAWNRFWRDADAQNWIGKPAVAQGRIKSKTAKMYITHPVMLTVGR